MSKDLKNRIGYIYKIISPNGKIYIGQTINIKIRKAEYRRGRFQGQIKLWRSSIAHNWKPIDTFEIIEECLCGENKIILNEREIYWIKFYNSHHDGLNCNDGGGSSSGVKLSEEHKRKLSEAHKGKIRSEESRRRQSETNKGHLVSKETREKISKGHVGMSQHPNCSQLGKKRSEESKEKMRLKKIGYIPWNVGIPCSEETKEKIKKANTGKKYKPRIKS